jgi:Dolichyl-phosphate-mannose-protein mannosyltransferase
LIKNRAPEIELITLLAILALAAFLRLANVADTPGWYTDEATHIDIARHLGQGEVRYMLITQSTLLFARPPLFQILLSNIFLLAGNDILVLRTFTGILGVISVALVYTIMRRTSGKISALVTALFCAVYPQAVLYSRFGYSYNLLPPLILIAMALLDRYFDEKDGRYLAAAALALGLGMISEVMMWTFIIPFVIVVIASRRWINLLWSIPLLFTPIALYVLVMLATVPDAFIFDLRFTLSRLGTASTLAQQWETLSHNIEMLVSGGVWKIAGFIGLWTLRPAQLRYIALLFLAFPVISMGRSVALFQLSAYYMIPFLPLFALGIGSLFANGLPSILQKVSQNFLTRGRNSFIAAPSFLIASLLVLNALSFDLNGIRNGFVTEIDSFLIPPEQGRAVAEYINTHAQPDDIIIATPAVGWQFHANVMDFQMSVAATDHIATPHLPADLPANRLAFDPNYATADYAVIDDLWRNWGIYHIPGLDGIMSNIQENWTLVFEAGDIAVYQNIYKRKTLSLLRKSAQEWKDCRSNCKLCWLNENS